MKLSKFVSNAGSFVLAIPNSYATILFSDSALLGLLLLIVTFVSPIVGLSGLIGLITALLLSRIAGFEPSDSKSGVCGFNSLILSMAFAYYYPNALLYSNPGFYLFSLITASIFTLFLYLVLNYFTQMWIRMPSMSLAFSISATMIWYYFAKIGYLANYVHDKPLLFDVPIALPDFWRMYFVSLGSIFFSPTVLSGMAIALALLIISRIGFGLSLWGWLLCSWLLQAVGMGSGEGMFYPGFNIILIVMAVGSVYLIPGKAAFVLASLAAFFGFMLTILMSNTFHYYNPFTLHYVPLAVPVFAFPINIIVFLVVFTLRLRTHQVKPLMNDYGVFVPERALLLNQEKVKRFKEADIPQFAMPLNGEWRVTQGHHGSHTHKLEWAFAWDFEIEDIRGNKFSGEAHKLHDYYAFSKPIYAAAAGYVSKVFDGILDNEIGDINSHYNWGNYISISHGWGLYSLYAHLKNGSATVKEGDYVSQGSKLGLVGNSGRSPFPHLHFQIQAGPDVGSRTILSHLVNYKLRHTEDQYRFVSSGIPCEGDFVSALVPQSKLQNILNLQYQQEYKFQVLSLGNTWQESWKINLDFYGTFRILSSKGSELECSVYNGIYNTLGFRKRGKNALYTFAYLLSRLPYMEKSPLSWQDEGGLSVYMNPILQNFVLFLMPIFKPVRVIVESASRDLGNHLEIKSKIIYKLPFISLGKYSGLIIINKHKGIESIELYKADKLILKARNLEIEE